MPLPELRNRLKCNRAHHCLNCAKSPQLRNRLKCIRARTFIKPKHACHSCLGGACAISGAVGKLYVCVYIVCVFCVCVCVCVCVCLRSGTVPVGTPSTPCTVLVSTPPYDRCKHVCMISVWHRHMCHPGCFWLRQVYHRSGTVLVYTNKTTDTSMCV